MQEGDDERDDEREKEKAKRGRVELRIGGMTCGACVASIESVLSAQPGILSVQISLLAERGVVEYDRTYRDTEGEGRGVDRSEGEGGEGGVEDTGFWNPQKVAEEIDDIGFEAEVIEKSEIQNILLNVYGIQSPTEASQIDTLLQSLVGTTSISFHPPYTDLSLQHSPTLISLRQIVDTLTLSFPHLTLLPTSLTTSTNAQLASLQKLAETSSWRRTFLLSCLFAIPVFMITMLSLYLPDALMGWTRWRLWRGVYLGDLVAMGLTIPVQGWLARRFYRNAWKSMKHGSATM